MSPAKKARKPKVKKPVEPTGIARIDELAELDTCTIDDYVAAVSEYVRRSRELGAGPKKAGQIRLSNALGRALADSLRARIPYLADVHVGERVVSGALRTVNADVSEIHPLDGLRLAIELKPVNLAVGRAIWNRFGDIRTFAVNLHLKFPFCVVGGVLVIPTYEEIGTKEAAEAEAQETVAEEVAAGTDPSVGVGAVDILEAVPTIEPPSTEVAPGATARRKDTRHLIERAVRRLVRAGGRKTESDGAHLLEGIAVIVYDPDTGQMDQALPANGSGLRWEEFVDGIVAAYESRFEQ